MSVQTILFYFFITLAGVSATGILLTKNVFKGALFLLICLLSLAALYIFTFAEFVAITQIMIYAGGIVIVIIFGVMLTTKFSGAALKVENANIFSGLLASSAILILLLKFFHTVFAQKTIGTPKTDTVNATGVGLMTDFILPFELAGILLLIALIGAAVISTKTKTNDPDVSA